MKMLKNSCKLLSKYFVKGLLLEKKTLIPHEKTCISG